MQEELNLLKDSDQSVDQQWPWWPLLPLYPYGRRRTLVKELIPNQIWSLEQLQGLYYVAVPVRLTVIKVEGGLMLFNPLPPTREVLEALRVIQKQHGPVLSIVLPTASGLEHKIFMPSLARSFPKAQLWVCPGQWSFPIDLPLSWLGIPASRTKVFFDDGLPHSESCEWIQLGPLDLGLGRFQEISCYHRASRSLLVTDSLVGIQADPPEIFDLDPYSLLFHSRDRGDEPLFDTTQTRKKGWARVVLFASFLRPANLEIPNLFDIFKYAFRPKLLNPRAHFGIYPFEWKQGWEESAKELIGENEPLLQIAPVLQRLVFPRAQKSFLDWIEELRKLNNIQWLIPAHHYAPIEFNQRKIRSLLNELNKKPWVKQDGNWKFLDGLDKNLLLSNIVPEDPVGTFKD